MRRKTAVRSMALRWGDSKLVRKGGKITVAVTKKQLRPIWRKIKLTAVTDKGDGPPSSYGVEKEEQTGAMKEGGCREREQ
jgi:hypothetical protein